MDNEHKKLLVQLEELYGSKFEYLFDGALEGFAHYFSILNIEGIRSLLSDYNYYDGVSKDYYLKLIEKAFNDMRTKEITKLKAISGTCNSCIKGCEGFTFIDEKSGLYVDIIIEVKNKEITNFMECYDLSNDSNLNKKQRIVIKEFKVNR